jgi:hypothetical protein
MVSGENRRVADEITAGAPFKPGVGLSGDVRTSQTSRLISCAFRAQGWDFSTSKSSHPFAALISRSITLRNAPLMRV